MKVDNEFCFSKIISICMTWDSLKLRFWFESTLHCFVISWKYKMSKIIVDTLEKSQFYRLVFNDNCDKILRLFPPLRSAQCNSKSVSFIFLKSSLFVEETITFPYHHSLLKSVKISIFCNFSKYDKINEILK